jgi:dienelactone hydrolase
MKRYLLLLACVCGLAQAQELPVVSDLADGRTGRFLFATAQRSTIPSEVQRGNVFYTDNASGTLMLPKDAKFAAPYPAVLVAHGSGGVLKRDYKWAAWFLEQGIAVMVVDSFKYRGFQESSTDQSRLTIAAHFLDHVQAFKLLKTHPKIDSRKIGLIGFSRGGAVASVASIESALRAVLPGDNFAFLISYYGSCSYRGDKYTSTPMLLLMGDQDTYADAETCKAWYEHSKAHKAPHELVLYPGVHHGFDNEAYPNRLTLANAQTGKECRLEWNLDQKKYRGPSGSWKYDNDMNGYLQSCMKRGTTIEYNDPALQDSLIRIRELLVKTGITQK